MSVHKSIVVLISPYPGRCIQGGESDWRRICRAAAVHFCRFQAGRWEFVIISPPDAKEMITKDGAPFSMRADTHWPKNVICLVESSKNTIASQQSIGCFVTSSSPHKLQSILHDQVLIG